MSSPASVPAAPAAPAPSRHDPYAPLRIGAFRLYIVALFAITLATQMQAVVVEWQMYAATHDPLALGLIGLAEALPFIALSLFAGHTADVRDRRRIAVAALAVLLGCSAGLLTITLHAPGGVPHRVLPIYLLVATSGVARSFLQPARTALSAELVPREIWPTAIAWRGSTWQFAAVLGPAVGGLLYGFGGAASAYATVAALLLVGVVGFAAIRYTRRVIAPRTESVRESVAAALRYVFHQRIVLSAITLDLFAVLFGGATALLPIFANEVLHVGPQGLGLLRAAPAAGSVVMSIVIAHRPPMRRVGRDLFVAVALFGLCMIAFALSHSFALSIALLTLSGMADNVSVVVRSTLLQVLTPEHLFGRVTSINSIFVGSSNEIGAFESGLAARLMGTVTSVVFGGVMTLVVVGTLAWRVPELRRLKEIR